MEDIHNLISSVVGEQTQFELVQGQCQFHFEKELVFLGFL